MVRLDSIKILVPVTSINDIKTNHFIESKKNKDDNIISEILSADNLGFGINRIAIDKRANNMTLDLSAKALMNDYANGININTYEQLISNINNLPNKIINLNSNEIYNKGLLLKADVTDNVKINYSGNIYNDLALIPLSQKYETTQYNTRTNKGLVFNGKQKSFKERLIFYDKLTELRNNKKGRDFLETINKAKVYNEFKDSVRVETNFTQLRKIREYLGSNNISDVLASDSKVNYNIFKKITKSADTKILYLFNQYEGMTLRQIKDRVGIEGIIKNADFNWQYINNFILSKSPNNYRRERQSFLKIYNEILVETNINTDSTIITLFLEALSKVA